MKVLFIIPAYNEEKNIENTCRKILDYNKDNGTDYEFIVINDGSCDATSEICRKNGFPVIDLVHNLGIGGAVQTGYKYALAGDYDVAIQFDGDGQHDVACASKIIAPIASGEADMVIGSRFVEKTKDNFESTFMRRVGINLISFNTRLVTGKKVYDVTSGFRASGKKIIKMFASSYPTEYPEPITDALVLKQGFAVKEVPVEMHERTGGVSSIRAWKTVYYMINVNLSIFLLGGKKK